MKKLHITFGILSGIMTLTAIVIALIMFVKTIRDHYTSFPVWAPLAIVGIYYSIGLAVISLIWFSTWLILWCMACKKHKKAL